MKAITRLLLETADDLPIRGEPHRDPNPPHRILGQDFIEDRHGAIALKSSSSREHLEEHTTHGKDVRRGPDFLPRTCSGAMYPTVPITIPGGSPGHGGAILQPAPRPSALWIRARPKSRILTWPSCVMKRFSGLRSRWMIPCRGRRRDPGRPGPISAALRAAKACPASVPGASRPPAVP